MLLSTNAINPSGKNKDQPLVTTMTVQCVEINISNHVFSNLISLKDHDCCRGNYCTSIWQCTREVGMHVVDHWLRPLPTNSTTGVFNMGAFNCTPGASWAWWWGLRWGKRAAPLGGQDKPASAATVGVLLHVISGRKCTIVTQCKKKKKVRWSSSAVF